MQYVPVNSDDTEPAPRAAAYQLFSGKLLESFELVEAPDDKSTEAVATLSFFEEGLVISSFSSSRLSVAAGRPVQGSWCCEACDCCVCCEEERFVRLALQTSATVNTTVSESWHFVHRTALCDIQVSSRTTATKGGRQPSQQCNRTQVDITL
jgi:hypothetical protein